MNNLISREDWIRYLEALYKAEDAELTLDTLKIVVGENAEIGLSHVQQALQMLKSMKSSGQDVISNELLKYGGERLVQ